MIKRIALLCLLSACSKPKEPDIGGKYPMPPPTPIPTPPPEDVETKTFCEMEWPLEGEPAGRSYLLNYNVTKTKSKDIHVAFKSVYQTDIGSLVQDRSTARYGGNTSNGLSAKMATAQWELTLKGKTASIKRVHTNEIKEVLCD
jgi:hypothetical protein